MLVVYADAVRNGAPSSDGGVGGWGRPRIPTARCGRSRSPPSTCCARSGSARVKQCANCNWLFVDRSRNGSRRWCSMDECGVHVKMRRYRAARRRVNRLAAREHRDELGDPLRARLRPLRVLDAVEDRVAVVAVELLEELARGRVGVERGAQVVRHLAVVRRVVGGSQRPSAFARSTSASPAGCIAPRAISASALARLIFDQIERARRGVKRWRYQSSSMRLAWPSIQP